MNPDFPFVGFYFTVEPILLTLYAWFRFIYIIEYMKCLLALISFSHSSIWGYLWLLYKMILLLYWWDAWNCGKVSFVFLEEILNPLYVWDYCLVQSPIYSFGQQGALQFCMPHRAWGFYSYVCWIREKRLGLLKNFNYAASSLYVELFYIITNKKKGRKKRKGKRSSFCDLA